MNARVHRALASVVLSTLALSGCSSLFDSVADTVLANEVRLDDREAPPTAHSILPSADAVQILGGQGQGLSCSLPWGAQSLAFTRTQSQAPIALQMRQACAFHDYCYRHGNATYGYSQNDCDRMLQEQAFRLCKFINSAESISRCETNARKVVLGVRLGGAGSFKRARAANDDEASTFFEFDPYPAHAQAYRVVRVADAPQLWLKNGSLPKAAYMFEMRPSGTRVSIVGWTGKGAMVCAAFELPAAFASMNLPPLVARAAPSGEDWFVWWRRHGLTNTAGRFSFLAPGRAMAKDWEEAAGGYVAVKAPGCNDPLWPRERSPLGRESAASFVTPQMDKEFSEVHALPGGDARQLRLLGLTTHSSCARGRLEGALLCIIDVQFDVATREFKTTTHPVAETGCGDSCEDRYRNYVAAPFIVGGAEPQMLWTRRGARDGAGYEGQATVRRYAVPPSSADAAFDLKQLVLAGFSEATEPVALVDGARNGPMFLSLEPQTRGQAVELVFQRAAASPSVSSQATRCATGDDASWLMRPAMLVAFGQPGQHQLVLSRVRIPALDMKTLAAEQLSLEATLELSVTSVSSDGRCQPGKKQQFKVFSTAQESKAIVQWLERRDGCRRLQNRACEAANADQAQNAYGRFAARTRGGQFIVADVTLDGVPDLVMVSQLPSLEATSSVLVGIRGETPLRFAPLAARSE